MNEKFLKPYDPLETEGRIYKLWEDSGYFNPDNCIKDGACDKNADIFSMVLPPPNVTGTLHMGHTTILAIEDIMVRFNRMNGKRTLWLPGTDHAAIATQSKVEKILSKEEGKRRHDLGREEFLKRVDDFAQKSHDTITHQIRSLGASVDWSREAFTLDEKRSLAVRTAFKRMYDDGIIYQGTRIVNWDPKGQTTVSDEEVTYVEGKGKFYTFKYSHDFPISIATTRPETKVGDTAVAVHPEDPRYQQYIDKEYAIVFAGVPIHIKVVGDTAVEKEFGTGAVGVTPAHSAIDWEIAQRHGLPSRQVINEYGKMMVDAPELTGKKIAEARAIIVEWLKNENLLEKEEEIPQNLATAERTGGIIEPLPKKQWFINVNKEFILKESKLNGIASGEKTTLKKMMRAVVETGQTTIIPDRFEKVYFHWIDNLRDWCISRQIWYGHRIPVWYSESGEIYVGIEAPSSAKATEGEPKEEGWKQDEDTLDTWFSSGLWTFSTLGWPDTEAPDFKNYHPTSMLETGYDILFFWVARMILMSGYLLGDVPFRTVYLHGLVRDAQGRKMSKSLGNGIDPVDMAEKYGADATRLSLIIGTGPGNDTRVSEDKIRGYKHFANKIWNVTRYVLSSVEGMDTEQAPELTEEAKERLVELENTMQEITEDMENYRFYLAGEKLYHYAWHTFADVIIEESKDHIFGDDQKTKASSQWVLWSILISVIKALHPFMPFVTEEIWSMMPIKNKKLLIIEQWPHTTT
ncbi:MAG: valine--tRNA ligase [Candidatus Paceibacterota bacterium]|jgi:valyl-tRNA synthetase|nr:valine--tRNA ligase [Candidatus Paceibacterota bacterium]